MTASEVSSGLVLPYAAITIAGKGGAAAILLMIFMAVTSTLSAQVIAVSSILSFDVYREYFNRSATDRDVIRASHLGVIFFAAFAAGFSTMLHYVGVDLGWTLYMLGKKPAHNPGSKLTGNRRGHLSRHLPDDLHGSLAPTESSRCDLVPDSGPGDGTRGLAFHRESFWGRGFGRDNG